MKMLAVLVDGPTLCMYSGEGKAEEANHEILHHCISD
jgi:hypothetical protein